MEFSNELKDFYILSDSYVKRIMDEPTGKAEWYKRVSVPKGMFGKIFYLVYQGKLREFKVVKTMHFPSNIKWTRPMDGEKMDGITLINIAGIGEKWVVMCVGCSFYFPIYSSVESFKANKPIKTDFFVPYLDKVFNGLFDFVNDRPVRWHWDGVKPTYRYIASNELPLYFFYTGNNNYVVPKESLVFQTYNGYTSSKECEKDNEIQIARFSDDDTSKTNEEMVVGEIFGTKVSLTKDQLAKVKEFINKL